MKLTVFLQSFQFFCLTLAILMALHNVFTFIEHVLFIIFDTLVSTIGLTPKQNGRRHFSPLILQLE